jgi:hypothetical protein
MLLLTTFTRRTTYPQLTHARASCLACKCRVTWSLYMSILEGMALFNYVLVVGCCSGPSRPSGTMPTIKPTIKHHQAYCMGLLPCLPALDPL